ncbi:NAD(P)-dependent oxidoreductase [Larsenimonas suaedae]|uniref:NAD(P)-dependent oxidoreductase n=1 Tax=Larsenimonas suaedae TaxID=1851019 RepID=A0ABU1GR98_9GAMM|nr:NAD(P)-dependent oxidoreductase [Larsenimonas suaedae]MCM2972645.1 NAD(P)-dependent oxidoreductase [Larsenimonas suaedae]MDR5894558.1 NAD(P)-dependent oxidoreductase [Larsenimonas suaedae]
MSHSHITVAVLGLGAMGHAFAANLLKNEFTLRLWNRTRARGEDLEQQGATLCDTPADAVRGADVVLTMLPDIDTTREVMFDQGALEAMQKDATFLQMGTLGVEPTDDLVQAIATQRSDVVVIDAPVSGTKAPAENAQVLVLASGKRERAPHIDAVFEAISKGARWLGEAGAGARMKLVVNAWLIEMMQGIAESAQLAKTLGFSTDDFWSVLDGGPLAAPYVKAKLDMIKSEDFEAQMALEWGLKDARLALEAADTTPMPGLQGIEAFWREADGQGHAKDDIASIYAYLDTLKRG